MAYNLKNVFLSALFSAPLLSCAIAFAANDEIPDFDDEKKPAAKAAPAKAEAIKKENEPIKTILMVNSINKNVDIVGRNKDKLVCHENGKELSYKISEIQSADFRVDYEEYKVQELEMQKKWADAYNLILKAYLPTLNFIDLNENSAVEPLMLAGTYMMDNALLEVKKSPPGKLNEAAVNEYKKAYTLFTKLQKAQWFPGVKTAQLKSILCLLAIGNLDKAAEQFEEIGEPEMGDISYGLYWMVDAKILYEMKKNKEAIEAAIKSIVYDNKDIDSFPDALMLLAQCHEDNLDYYRARDIYFEVSNLFQKTDWGDNAFKRLCFIMDKGLTKKKEDVTIDKVFFDSAENMNDLAEKYIKEKLEEGKEDGDKPSGKDKENKADSAKTDGSAADKAKDSKEEKPVEKPVEKKP